MKKKKCQFSIDIQIHLSTVHVIKLSNSDWSKVVQNCTAQRRLCSHSKAHKRGSYAANLKEIITKKSQQKVNGFIYTRESKHRFRETQRRFRCLSFLIWFKVTAENHFVQFSETSSVRKFSNWKFFVQKQQSANLQLAVWRRIGNYSKCRF